MGACPTCGGADGYAVHSGELWGACVKHQVRWQVPGEQGRNPGPEYPKAKEGFTLLKRVEGVLDHRQVTEDDGGVIYF